MPISKFASKIHKVLDESIFILVIPQSRLLKAWYDKIFCSSLSIIELPKRSAEVLMCQSHHYWLNSLLCTISLQDSKSPELLSVPKGLLLSSPPLIEWLEIIYSMATIFCFGLYHPMAMLIFTAFPSCLVSTPPLQLSPIKFHCHRHQPYRNLTAIIATIIKETKPLHKFDYGTGWSKKTKAVDWEFPFNCFFGPPGKLPPSSCNPKDSTFPFTGEYPGKRNGVIKMFHLY